LAAPRGQHLPAHNTDPDTKNIPTPTHRGFPRGRGKQRPGRARSPFAFDFAVRIDLFYSQSVSDLFTPITVTVAAHVKISWPGVSARLWHFENISSPLTEQ
jgi:hypothetical protein